MVELRCSCPDFSIRFVLGSLSYPCHTAGNVWKGFCARAALGCLWPLAVGRRLHVGLSYVLSAVSYSLR